LDWELDNTFFKRRDFDYVQECDAFEPTTEIQTPPALCQLRPRVMEMLGSALPTNGYLSNKHPLQLKLKGSRNLAPHVKIYQTDVPYELPPVPGEDEIQIEYRPADVLEIQIPDLEVSFYALEIDESKGLDEFGNPSVLLNEDEIPVVRSMIPGSPEPAPIIKVRATLLIALEVGQIYTPEDDASKLAFSIRPISEYSRIIFKKIPGGNATTVPDNSILSSFREKLRYGIEIYGDPDEPLEIKIPKSVSLEMLNDFLGSFNLLDLN